MSKLIRFVSLPIRGSFASRARFYAKLLDAKRLTVAELRRLEGLES